MNLSKGNGGAERLFVDLCNGLADRGIKVLVICDPAFPLAAELNPDIEVETIRTLSHWLPFASYHFKAALKRFKPDLLHCHLARASRIGGRYGRSLGIRTLCTTHNNIKARYIRHIDFFTTTTQAQRSHLLGLGISPKKIEVIANFSMMSACERAPDIAADKPFRWLSYGRFVDKKGFALLLEAFARYCQLGGSGTLTLGGSGPNEAALREQVESLQINQRVEFAGWISNPMHFLDAHDGFILPSLDEPFGLVILEAMARGKVLVCSETHGPLEVLDSTSAYLFPVGDADALAHALMTVECHLPEARDKARVALMRYKDNYTQSTVINRYIQLFQKLAA